MLHENELHVATPGRGTTDVTFELQAIARASGISSGLCNVFCRHTSASLIVCENADPDVRGDLESWLARAVPDGDRSFRHTCEGPDDMPAHVRATLTSTSLSLPLRGGELDLGTWQGIYLYEHRHAPHRRRLSITILGE